MFRRAAALAVVGLLVSAQAALAAGEARLDTMSGTVMVSKNGQLVPGAPGMVLNSGDRVIASKGSATVVYSDGCDVRVETRSMETVGEASPCAGAARTTTRVSSQTGSGGLIYGAERDFWLWLGYGALTATVVGLALDDDSQPVSP